MLLIERATRKDAMLIVPWLRQADRDEIAAATGLQTGPVISLSFDISERCWTLRHHRAKRPFALFGVCNAGVFKGSLKGGIVWMVATDAMQEHGLAFARMSREIAGMCLEGYDIIFNYVWAGNFLHKRWLAWSGFTVYPPIKRGPFDQYFHPFHLTRKDATCALPSPSP